MEVEWPKGCLTAFLEGQVEQGNVAADDVEQIKSLHRRIADQLPLLSAARKALREFIKSNFSIEDLLYARDSA